MIFAKRAYLTTGWADNVRLSIFDGRIVDVTFDSTPEAEDSRVDVLLPALANLHSHSFQRAMAGMSEYRMAGKDSFWTWRELMYRFTAHLTPAHVQAIAELVFMEMQEAGYASVGEFHYIHHQADGTPYEDISELSQRVFAAAQATGIGLTHLPVLYTYGGAGQVPLLAGQARFGNSVEHYFQLVERAQSGIRNLPNDCMVGIAPHSLRATSPDDLKMALKQHSCGPIHIHISEQPKEVSDIEGWLGARPVEWLLENANVDSNWCLIHATHMTQTETVALAHTGAVAGLCPVTEANLGDGPFNGPTYLQAGGRIGVGSDSNILISLTEELRTLEYSQRLRDLARNVLVDGEGSVGKYLYLNAARGGAQALGRVFDKGDGNGGGTIEPGAWADLVAINSDSPALCALRPDQLLDGLVFAANDDVVTDLWSAGRHCVRSGRHLDHERIVTQYRTAMAELVAAI